ncbi:MAG: hypothetical protein FWF92_03890 [Oscillospiraceae bacterium]|nr:hypothetical protein [Oscillospiraceae bacterium]
MLIRCSDNCKFQEDGFCGLKNIYSASVANNTDEVNDSGCLYYKPKIQKRKTPENQKNTDQTIQSDQARQKYF